LYFIQYKKGKDLSTGKYKYFLPIPPVLAFLVYAPAKRRTDIPAMRGFSNKIGGMGWRSG
jgi:hypothetical protein